MKMLREDNTTGRMKWMKNNTRALLLAGLLASAGGLGGLMPISQAMGQWSTLPPTGEKLDAPLVDWSHAQQMYRLAEGWLAQGDTAGALPGPAVEVSGVSGVRVTLRWGGLRMGSGQVGIESVKPVRGNAYDLTDMTRQAIRGAMLEASAKLRQSYQSQPPSTEAEDASSQRRRDPRTLADLQGQVLMDIQVAGPLQAVRIPADAPAGAIYHHFAPGYHGLRMSAPGADGTILASWVWPADSLAAGVSPNGQVLQLMGGLGVKLDQQPRIGKPGSPAVERFEVIHMVRAGVHEPITRLVRGNVLLPPTSIDESTLDNMTLRMVDHLRRKMRSDGQFAGAYLPSTDIYQPPVARMDDAALACLALSRWAMSGIGLPASQRVVAANELVRQWVNANLPAMLNPQAHPSPTGMALTLLVLTENPAMAGRQVERDMLARRLLKLRLEDGSFRTKETGKPVAMDGPMAALVVDSLSAYYLQSRHQEVADALPDSIAQVWDHTDPLKSIGALPWLLEADARLETLTTDGRNPLNPHGLRAARLARLAPTYEILLSRQITAPPAVGPADVIGGFELRELDESTPPNPDWRTAHILMILSQNLRSSPPGSAPAPGSAPGSIPGSDARRRMDELLACGRAARFLAQLMFDEPGAYYVRSVPDVVGGVRFVLWDNRLDLSPTAMTLLACCDLKKTLGQWSHQP